jgi:hypothetical protein
VPAIVAKPVQYSPELDKVCASGYGPLTELLGRLSCSISLGETLGNVTVKDACVKNGTENHAVSFADIGKKKCDLLKQWVAADSSIIRKSDCPANKPNPSFGEWVNVSKSGADKCKIAVAQEIKGVAAVPAHYQYGDVACTVTTEAVVNDAN